MRYILLLFCLFFLTIIQAQENKNLTKSSELIQLFEKISGYEDAMYPEDSLYLGRHVRGSFSKSSVEFFDSQSTQLTQFVHSLNKIDNSTLSRQEYISKQTMLLKLNNSISAIKFKMYLIPFNAEGGFYNSMSYVLGNLPFNTIDGYEAYLKWLPQYIQTFEDNIVLMKAGIKQGIVAPKVIVNNTLSLIKPWIKQDPKLSPFYGPFNNIPDNWAREEKEEITKKGIALIKNVVLPGYSKLEKFMREEYLNAAMDGPGVSNITGGKQYYENRVNYYTTLNMSPDSVHSLGLLEVARIKSQMEEIIKEVNFTGSFADFLKFLRTDPQFYAKTPQELLNHAAWLSKKAEGQLPRLFKKLYSLPFTVEPVPDDIAPTYTSGRFVGGSWDQQRAGIYWVNTYDLPSRPLYTLPSLSLHEAVPGHHLQGSLALELEGLPDFRNNFYISAFGEGWGLYSEYLGEDMGMYSTPYEWFGRYTYEMWRACRLVVDTGIHYKGWSRDQAVEYLRSNTALSIHEVNTEIDRYIGWPGQAVSYKIGELKIKELRKRAEKQLGDRFDIREFHYNILKNGSVPLTILEEEINNYISSALPTK